MEGSCGEELVSQSPGGIRGSGVGVVGKGRSVGHTAGAVRRAEGPVHIYQVSVHVSEHVEDSTDLCIAALLNVRIMS